MPHESWVQRNLNSLLLACACSADIGLLWLASQPTHVLVRLSAAVFFAFTNNMVFSLLHEAVHGNFNPSHRVNQAGGRLAAAFFPTSFIMQRAFHLTHHRNNRSDEERFDYIGEDDNVFLKTAQWYSILTGLYWLSIPVFAFVFALLADTLPPLMRLVQRWPRFARQTSASAYFGSLGQLPRTIIRLEVLLALALHGFMLLSGTVTAAGWLLCYCAFGLMWSSLQYADHAFTRLDREEGAWNLTVSSFTRAMFLNYHFHLAHHRNPALHWQDLPVHGAAGQKISYKRILYLMWAGPRLLRPAVRARRQLDFSVKVALCLVVISLFGLIYWLCVQHYDSAAPSFDIGIPLDQVIPFWPLTASVYLTVMPLVLCVPLLYHQREELLPIAAVFVIQVLVAGFFFVVLPIKPLNQPPTIGLGGILMDFARTISLRGNYFPSLHVAFALSAAALCSRKLSPLWAVAIWFWAIAIGASTLLSKQHYCADVVAGGLLAALSMWLVLPWLQRLLQEVKAEVTIAQQVFV